MRNRSETIRRDSWSSGQRSIERSGFGDVCLSVVDVGMAAVVFATPFLFGGRHPIGLLIFVAICCLTSLAWFLRQTFSAEGRWSRSFAPWMLVLALGVTALQLVSLPTEWIEALAPRLKALLPLWSQDSQGSTHFGAWSTLSMAPAVTRQALAVLVAYVLLFITASQRLTTKRDIERVLKWIALSVIASAVFAIVQYLTANGKYFWFYEYPFTSTLGELKGSFTNRNHFAHFLVLGLGPLIGCACAWKLGNGSRSGSRGHESVGRRAGLTASLLLSVSALIVVSAILLTRSRGGVLALGIAMLVLGGIYLRYRIVNPSTLGLLISVGFVLLVAVLSCYGFDRVAGRLDDFTAGSVDELDNGAGRRTIWKANTSAIEAGWLVGSGAGTHRFIYPAYLNEPRHRTFTHAENGYLQVVTENGLPGAVLVILIIGCCGIWCWGALSRSPNRDTTLLAGGVCASLVASLVHSAVDFVWYVPACMAVTVLLAACALRLYQLNGESADGARYAICLRRPVWIGLCVLVALGSGFAIVELIGPAKAANHWHRYQLANTSHKQVRKQQTVQAAKPLDETELADRHHTQYIISELRQVVAADPANAQAHLKLALHLLRQFELEAQDSANRMTVAQIRDTAFRSRFSSSEELRSWLSRAFGEQSNYLYMALFHTRRAIELAPLQGEAYVQLSRLCFLEGSGEEAVEECLTQALSVGPYDIDVLFAVGRHHVVAQRFEEAFQYWRPVFLCPTADQFAVVNILAGPDSAELLLSELRPGAHALPYIWRRYQEVGMETDWAAIESYVADVAKNADPQENLETTVRLWRLLARIQIDRQRPQQALASLGRAAELKPDDFNTRHRLGLVALQLGKLDLSEAQLKWCLGRHPERESLQQSLLEVKRLRLSQRAPANDQEFSL